MRVKQWGTALGSLLLAAGCAHESATARQGAPGANQPVATSGGAAGDNVAREKDMLMSQADGTQPGTIRSFTGDTITVDGRGPGAPVTMTLRIDSSVPVFRGNQRAGTDVLTPGQDVRVFYKNPTDNTQPQAIAVEITPQANPASPASPPDPSVGEPAPTAPSDVPSDQPSGSMNDENGNGTGSMNNENGNSSMNNENKDNMEKTSPDGTVDEPNRDDTPATPDNGLPQDEQINR